MPDDQVEGGAELLRLDSLVGKGPWVSHSTGKCEVLFEKMDIEVPPVQVRKVEPKPEKPKAEPEPELKCVAAEADKEVVAAAAAAAAAALWRLPIISGCICSRCIQKAERLAALTSQHRADVTPNGGGEAPDSRTVSNNWGCHCLVHSPILPSTAWGLVQRQRQRPPLYAAALQQPAAGTQQQQQKHSRVHSTPQMCLL